VKGGGLGAYGTFRIYWGQRKVVWLIWGGKEGTEILFLGQVADSSRGCCVRGKGIWTGAGGSDAERG